MPTIDVEPGMTRQDKIASLAGAMTQMHLHALSELEEHGVIWWDIAYAAVLALRAIGTMQTGDDEKRATAELERIIGMALKQDVIAKRFTNKAEYEAWADANGLDPDDTDVTVVAVPPEKNKGPVH